MARPLRQQVVVISSIVSLVVFGALVYASRLTYQEQLQQLESETNAMTAVLVNYLQRNLAAADATAVTVSRHPSVQQLLPRAATDVLQPLVEVQGQMIRNVVIADAGGKPVAWARPPMRDVEGRLSRAWLAQVATTRRPSISPLLGEPGAEAHAIVLGYPIVNAQGDQVGVLGLVADVKGIEQVLARVPLPEGSVVTLTDERGVVVARSIDSTSYAGRPVEDQPDRLQPIHDVPRTLTRRGVDGVERVFGNAVVERGPFLASVGIPTSVAIQRTAPIYRRNYAIAAGASLIFLALSLIFVRRWLNAIGEVGMTAERVAKGDLSPLDSKAMGFAELDQLRVSLAGMINNLREAREAIAAQVGEERHIRQEMVSLQRQLIRQERLAAIGVLVSGVAHELNNPLQAILGFAELLQMQQDLPEHARADLTLIQRESARASAIIRNLSRFGRHTAEPSPIRLRDVVHSVLELRQRKIDELDIQLDFEDQSDEVVSAVFTELQQVVLNFLINAEQVVCVLEPPRRRVRIRTSDARNYARLEVEDWGDGVPPADESKLFQPFFTTKPVGVGTGLGLSVSYGIITSHGGEIGYRRSVSGGAVFYFELPTRRAEGL